jgi:glycosyltransferase involved in cell wall biosynthesis
MCIISVVIPTFGPDIYIFDCLNSLKRQTFSKEFFEILVIFNGDKELYYDCLNTFINTEFKEYNIQLFYTNIIGVSNARNIGIEQSEGKYLAFIDDDDIVSDNYLQGLYDIAKNNNMPLSYARAFTNDISHTTNYYITDVYERFIDKKIKIIDVRSYFSSACYKLLDREMIGKQRFDPRFQNGEDSLFMFAVSQNNRKIQFTSKISVYYRRIRGNSLTTRKISFLYKIKNNFRLIGAIIAIYLKTPVRYNFLFFISRILALLTGPFKMIVK